MLTDEQLLAMKVANELPYWQAEKLFADIDELKALNTELRGELAFCVATIERLGESYEALRAEWLVKNATPAEAPGQIAPEEVEGLIAAMKAWHAQG
jgi:hypothetical protein